MTVSFTQLQEDSAAESLKVLRFIANQTVSGTALGGQLANATTVSALVHLYSWGYMDEDPDQPRFFAYLSLFTFAMLMLVTADNLVQMFFGWEGVGLASYLLIGFWFKKPSAGAAATATSRAAAPPTAKPKDLLIEAEIK